MEKLRLKEARKKKSAWKKSGPYLSERQWGTVRKDYCKNGDAWNFFTHDNARSRAYRWGEDGITGISYDKQPDADQILSGGMKSAFIKDPGDSPKEKK